MKLLLLIALVVVVTAIILKSLALIIDSQVEVFHYTALTSKSYKSGKKLRLRREKEKAQNFKFWAELPAQYRLGSSYWHTPKNQLDNLLRPRPP